MSATLFGDRFLGRREPAWHKLGEVFSEDEKMTATEGMRRANIMFGIDKHKQFVKLPTGEFVETGSYGVVREPTPDDDQYRILGTVGKEWTALQPQDLGKMLDPISETFPVETVGAIGMGEKIFLSLDASESKIAGEDHHLYWLITDARDGTGSLTIAFTPVRVVCQNTLITGLRSSKVSVNLKHNKAINSDTEFYLDIFNQMGRVQEGIVTAMDSLTKNTLVQAQADQIITSAYPNASKPNRLKLSDGITADDVPAKVWTRILADRGVQEDEYGERQKRIDRIKDNANERLEVFNQEHSKYAMTPWAVYNAVVETEDYRRGHEKSGTQLFGSRAESKARAFNKALTFVK